MTHLVSSHINRLEEPEDVQELFTTSYELPIDIKKHYKAFIHKSFLQDFRGEIESNERLEFLGDTVLELLISEKLFMDYPHFNEGQLSKLRASLVNAEKLYQLALGSKLYEFLILGKGGRHHSHPIGEGPLADVVEAILGSVYEQEGIAASKKLFQALLENYRGWAEEDYMDHISPAVFDPKSALQEKVIHLYGEFPRYIDKKIGHQLYEVDLFINKKKILSDRGASKKKVQKNLANMALEKKLYE